MPDKETLSLSKQGPACWTREAGCSTEAGCGIGEAFEGGWGIEGASTSTGCKIL